MFIHLLIYHNLLLIITVISIIQMIHNVLLIKILRMNIKFHLIIMYNHFNILFLINLLILLIYQNLN